MRATRDLLRRRLHLVRKRAQLLTHIQITISQYNLPAFAEQMPTRPMAGASPISSRTAWCARLSQSISR